MEPLNTYREGKVEVVERLPNLHVFMYTNEWTGDYVVISIRTEQAILGARIEAAQIYGENMKDKGGSYKDAHQDFMDEAKLVEFVDTDFFHNFRTLDENPIGKEDWEGKWKT